MDILKTLQALRRDGWLILIQGDDNGWLFVLEGGASGRYEYSAKTIRTAVERAKRGDPSDDGTAPW